MTWSNTFKAVQPYIVKIETPAGSGTGFFFAYNENKAMVGIATALHVIEDADNWRQPIKIVHVESKKELFLPHGDRAVLVDYKRDSATILVMTKALIDSGLPVPSDMLTMVPSDKFKPVGVLLAWAGYPAIAPRTLCLFQGSVSAFNKSNDSYYLDGIAINGVSGGPVFCEKPDAPEIVGIVSAYHYNQQSGGILPGLLMAHDATHLNTIVENIKSMDDARKKAAEAAATQKEHEPQASSGPTEPQTPRHDASQSNAGVSEPPQPAKRRTRRKRTNIT